MAGNLTLPEDGASVDPLFDGMNLTSADATSGMDDLAWNDNIRLFFETRFANFLDIFIPATMISYTFFFAIGGYLHVSLTYLILNDIGNSLLCNTLS